MLPSSTREANVGRPNRPKEGREGVRSTSLSAILALFQPSRNFELAPTVRAEVDVNEQTYKDKQICNPLGLHQIGLKTAFSPLFKPLRQPVSVSQPVSQFFARVSTPEGADDDDYYYYLLY